MEDTSERSGKELQYHGHRNAVRARSVDGDVLALAAPPGPMLRGQLRASGTPDALVGYMAPRRLALLGATLLSLIPTVAQAQPRDPPPMSATEKTTANGPAERFGRQGQIALSSDAALTIQSSSTSGVPGSTMTVSLHPAADYFVMQSISLGGFIGFDYAKTGDNHSSRVGIGPRIGYDLSLSDLVSVWPKVGFSYSSTSTTISLPTGQPGVTAGATSSSSASSLNLFVPLMFHPAPHFFAGFGPFLDTDLGGDLKTTVYGVKLTVGGYLLDESASRARAFRAGGAASAQPRAVARETLQCFAAARVRVLALCACGRGTRRGDEPRRHVRCDGRRVGPSGEVRVSCTPRSAVKCHPSRWAGAQFRHDSVQARSRGSDPPVDPTRHSAGCHAATAGRGGGVRAFSAGCRASPRLTSAPPGCERSA